MRKFHKIYVLFGAFLIHTFLLPLQADELDDAATAVYEWQYNRLFNPSPLEREAEGRGEIFIYDGLTDVTVREALDQHFDRIQNMMFTRTVITDENGDPEIDPITGNQLIEDDGC